MIQWVDVESAIISKIAYNTKSETLFVSYKKSSVDTPYSGVTQDMFKKLSKATDKSEYFEMHIKRFCKEIKIDTNNVLSCDL